MRLVTDNIHRVRPRARTEGVGDTKYDVMVHSENGEVQHHM